VGEKIEEKKDLLILRAEMGETMSERLNIIKGRLTWNWRGGGLPIKKRGQRKIKQEYLIVRYRKHHFGGENPWTLSGH